jgi:predicted transcriptional regulator
MDAADERGPDLRARLKQFTQPLVDSLDAKLRDEVDARVDERVETLLRDRLSVLERAIADLDRTTKALEARLDEGR